MPKPKERTVAVLKRQGAAIQQQRAKQVEERAKKQLEKQKLQRAIDRNTEAIKALDRDAATNARQLHQAKLQKPVRYPLYNLRNRPVVPKAPGRLQKASHVIQQWVVGFVVLFVVIGIILGLASLQHANGGTAPTATRRTAVVSATGGIGVKHRDTPDATTGSDGGPAENAQVQLLHYTAGWWEVIEPDGRHGYIENRYLQCDDRPCTEGMLATER